MTDNKGGYMKRITMFLGVAIVASVLTAAWVFAEQKQIPFRTNPKAPNAAISHSQIFNQENTLNVQRNIVSAEELEAMKVIYCNKARQNPYNGCYDTDIDEFNRFGVALAPAGSDANLIVSKNTFGMVFYVEDGECKVESDGCKRNYVKEFSCSSDPATSKRTMKVEHIECGPECESTCDVGRCQGVITYPIVTEACYTY